MAHPAMETGAATTPKTKAWELREFFERYAKAVKAADVPVLVAAWETPAFVLSDIGAHAVSSPDEIVKFFSGAKEHYNARGIVDTRADIIRYEWPSERMAIVTVRWPLIDSSTREIGYETSTYVLRRDVGGTLRVRSAVMHGATFEKLS
jgi:hypothetical protein